MAYQNVGTPRFYVDHLLWLKTLGVNPVTDPWTLGSVARDLIGLNPSSQTLLINNDIAGWTTQGNPWPYVKYLSAPYIQTSSSKWKAYFAILGHNAKSAGANINLTTPGGVSISPSGFINLDINTPGFDGFTICYDFDERDDETVFGFEAPDWWIPAGGYYGDFNIGCFSHGNYYDMPHSPELKLTMTREMDGVKRTRTKGGFDLVDHSYTKSPLWGSLAPWEIGGSINQKLSRVGRRSWDLSFNSLDGSDVFGSNQSLSSDAWALEIADETPPASSFGDDLDGNNNFNDNILTDDNFYSQVIHKTNGGQLPFIFQPDSDDLNNLAICKFSKKFSFKQVANGVYNVKMKIREVW